MVVFLLLLVASALALPVKHSSPIARKSLAGPPEEFAQHVLPDPAVGAIATSSASVFVTLSDTPKGASWTHIMDVDSTVGFSMNIFSPIEQLLTVTLVDPNGKDVDLSSVATDTFWPYGDSTATTIKGTSYNVETTLDGEYVLTLSSSESVRTINSNYMNATRQTVDIKHGYVIFYNAKGDRIYSHLASYTQQQGDQVGLVARMYDPSVYPTLVAGVAPAALPDIVKTATMEAVFPDGQRLSVPMHDDGLHADGVANDGIYGASFDASETGIYTVQASLEGTNAAGPFFRSAQHLVQVIPRSVQLTGAAFGEMGDSILEVHLELSGPSQGTFRPYFQLWGQDAAGADVAVAWFSSLEDVQTVSDRNVVSLDVDVAWIARAKAKAPFQLRGVYLQDASSWVPVSQVNSIDLQLSGLTLAALNDAVAMKNATGYNGEITLAMRQGVPPADLFAGRTNGGKLILIHGYCAEKNPFQSQPGDWTDALFFLNASQSMTIDEYSQQVITFAANQGLSSYGLIGHSQGGMVTLHILNYYHSGLDTAVGNRKIQALASPFHGNSGGGTAETLGKLFGMGCGANYDLSLDGAAQWLSGISAASIAQHNYYTTQYKPGGLFGNGWCNMLVNAILANPNDGATEVAYANLDGANHRSHVIGQCHVDGMNWPASYWDTARNAEMNTEAAR